MIMKYGRPKKVPDLHEEQTGKNEGGQNNLPTSLIWTPSRIELSLKRGCNRGCTRRIHQSGSPIKNILDPFQMGSSPRFRAEGGWYIQISDVPRVTNEKIVAEEPLVVSAGDDITKENITDVQVVKETALVIHGASSSDVLEQNVLNIATLSFDDNKVLKVQLDMLIFKQSIGSERTNESRGIFKGSLCCKSESEDIRAKRPSEACSQSLKPPESEAFRV